IPSDTNSRAATSIGLAAILTTALRVTCETCRVWRSMTAATSASLLGKYWYNEPILTPAPQQSCSCSLCHSLRSPKREQSLLEVHRRLNAIALERPLFLGLFAVSAPYAFAMNASLQL